MRPERDPLAGLHAIPWHLLSSWDAPRDGTAVANALAALAVAETDAERSHARAAWFFNVWHQGTRADSAAPSVPFVVAIAEAADRPDVTALMGDLLEVATGFSAELLPWGEPTYHSNRQDDVSARAAVEHAIPRLVAIATARSSEHRVAVARLAGWLPRAGTDALPALRAYLDDDDERCRAAAVLALGLIARAGSAEASEMVATASTATPALAAAGALARVVADRAPAADAVIALATAVLDEAPWTVLDEIVPSDLGADAMTSTWAWRPSSKLSSSWRASWAKG